MGLFCWAPVAHACNPSYSGGRDPEDFGSKSAQANSSKDLILKMPITKIGLVEWLKVKALSSSLSTTKKKKGGYFFFQVFKLRYKGTR
jgi:hypothetical protein